MAIYAKKYNNISGKWEVISPTSDNDVVVLNNNYTESGTPVTLNHTLSQISGDIEKLQRNVSWLAEHGGGGGGYGTGSASNYGIVVTNGGMTDNQLYVNSKNFTVYFKITGGTATDYVQYRCTYDGNALDNNYAQVRVNTTVKVDVSDIEKYSTVAPHTFIIDAIDPNGLSIQSYTLNITETSIVLSTQKDNVFKIGSDSEIIVSVTNKILNSEVTINVKNTTTNNTAVSSFNSNTTATQTVKFNFFEKLVDTASVKVGSRYNLTINGQVTTSSGLHIDAEEINASVLIQGSDKIVITLSDLPTKEEFEELDEDNKKQASSSGNLSFGFTPFFTSNVSSVYYAIKLSNGSVSKPVAGYFDLVDENGEAIKYNKNPFTTIGAVKTITTDLGDDFIGNEVLVEVKCWSADGLIVETVTGACKVIASSTNEYKTQVPIRGLNSSVGNTMYAFWGNKEFSNVNSDASSVKSSIANYLPAGSTDENLINSEVTMHVNGINGEVNGFMSDKGSSSFLRLSNEAYATVNISEDISKWLSNDGFTISVTFKSDYHPYNNRTIFFMGTNDNNNEFKSGLKIDLEKVYWYFTANGIQQKMEVNIKQNALTTVDFVYIHKTLVENGQNVNTGMAKIYVNGIINAAKEANSYGTSIPNTIYLGSNASPDGTIWNNADVNIYGLRIFSKYLNDIEVVVNSHNDRAKRLDDNSIDPVAYDEWKKRNYLLDPDKGSTIARSELYKMVNNDYTYLEKVGYAALADKQKTSLPIVYLDGSLSNFTKDIFFSTNLTTDQTKQKYENFTLNYFDPNVGQNGKEVQADTIGVSIQGTSTTTLRSKNLELYFMKTLANGRLEMFQPKDTWFPESEFTLKADVVDSAHANNATLGKWINEYGAKSVLEDNPAMIAARENKPRDVDENGNDYGVQSTLPDVKHTLEGFPVILLMRFPGESSPTFLGIYSFNLGRYSYFNMGFNFLKSYSRRKKNAADEYNDESTPALVDAYVPYERTETIRYNNGQNQINLSDVYSFEFGSDADDNTEEHATWSQDNLTVLEHLGEFKYNGGSDDHSSQPPSDTDPWLKLRDLFAQTARIPEPSTSKIYTYDSSSKTFKTNGEVYAETNEVETFVDKLSIKNAYGYFVIAMAFGMVDSLGKNMTLRTWGNGKWYPAFYDMDTALGLTNAGEESVPSTVYIDSFENSAKTDEPNIMTVKRNAQQAHGYGAYNSKLWNILRATSDERGNKSFWATHCESVWNGGFYGEFWRLLRDGSIKNDGTTNGPLSSPDSFISIFTDQTSDVGEMLYNDDFNVKYLTKYQTASGDYTYGNIEMLHGTRIEYIRSWLKDRFYFLDGVLNVSSPVNDQYPYYVRGYITCGGPEGGGYPNFIISTTSPTIFTAEIGQNGEVNKWFVPAYTDTKIILPQLSSDSKRIGINSTTIITKLDGLKDNRFEKFESMKLPSLSEIDLDSVTTLSKDTPVDFSTTFINKIDGKRLSDVRKINLSNSKGSTNFPVTLSSQSSSSESFNYWKVNTIDISHSCVSSLVLSSSPLSVLNVSDSDISNLTIESQPYLTDEDFNFKQCDSLEKLYIRNCRGLKTSLEVSTMNILNTLEVSNCAEIQSIVASGNTQLTSVTISSCSELTSLNLGKCTNENLQISIIDCPKLKTVILSGLKTKKPIIMPAADMVKSIQTLDLENSVGLDGFKFGETANVLQYNQENVLDLSAFTSLTSTGLKIHNTSSVKYVKFANVEGSPFSLGSNFFNGCTSLKRVFGNIKLAGTAIFNGCVNFSIHDLPTGEIEIPTARQFDESNENNNGFVTNIQIGVTSLNSMFAKTQCNLHDVYYILQKCDSEGNGNKIDVTDIANMFYNVKTIGTDTESNSLKAEAFSHCGKVTNISGLFYYCGLRTRIPSPMLDSNGNVTNNGMFQYMPNLTSFNSAFDGCTVYADDNLFHSTKDGKNLSINSITYFNPIFVMNSNSTEIGNIGWANAGKLFKYMPYLNNIDHSFNNSRIYFSHVDTNLVINNTRIYSTDIFYNTPNLTNINASFTNLTACGYIRNIFGGYSSTRNIPGHFSSKITAVTSSFSVSTISGDTTVPEDERNIANVYIGDSFLAKISNSIRYLGTSSKDGTSSSAPIFSGKFNKYVDTVDVDNATIFPSKVLRNCTNLIEAPGFFSNMKRPTGAQNIELTLPYYTENGEMVSMFADSINLSNFAYGFYHLQIPFTLKGFGFTNATKLKNVASLFEYTKLKGQVPYGLFYREVTNSYPTMKGLTYDGAIKKGIENGKYGVQNLVINASTNKVIVEFDNDNKIIKGKSEPFSSGGTIYYMDDYGELCPSTIGDNKTTTWTDSKGELHTGSTEDVKNPVKSSDSDIYTFNGSYKTYIKNITSMNSIFKDITTENLNAYALNLNADDLTIENYSSGGCSNVIEDNPDYNPIFVVPNDSFNPVLYIHNSIDGTTTLNPNYDPRRVKENSAYNKYRKIWNKWVNDGTATLYNAIVGSEIYEKIGTNDDIGISEDLPNDILNTSPTSETTLLPIDDLFSEQNDRQKVRNYLVAGDLFRYCTNYASIHSAFQGSGGANIDSDNGLGWPNTLKKGFYGSIPPFFFDNVRNTTSLANMFLGVKGLTPYNWAQKNSVLGNMFPPNLLNGMSSLTDVSHMFEGCYIYPYEQIPDAFFATNTKLRELSYLFYDCKFADTRNAQVPSNLFAKCSDIQNVSYMFYRNENWSYRAPYIMSSNLFTPEKNPAIRDVRYFMYYAGNTSGTVPEFWNKAFRNMTYYTGAYRNVDSTKITNYSSITDELK